MTSNLVPPPDANQTGDLITASTAAPVLQQNIAGLVDGGTYPSECPGQRAQVVIETK